MRKTLYISTILFLVALFSFATVNVALAQEAGGAGVAEEITTSDLGVENPGLLPTNPFYFLKEWGRGIRMTFTFNKVSKVGYELKVANNKAAELKKVQELHPDDTAAIGRALDNYNKNALRLKTRVQSLEESSENPNVDGVLDKLAENAIKHQQLFEELKSKHEDLRGKFDDTEKDIDETLEHIVKNIDRPEKAAERLDKAIESQKESQSKELRAIHFLNQLEKDLDLPEVTEKLSELKDKHVNKLEVKLKSGLVRPSEVGGLVKNLSHDDLEIFDVLRELEHRLADIHDDIKLDDLEEEVLEEASDKESDFASRAKEEIERAEKIIRELEAKLSVAHSTTRETEPAVSTVAACQAKCRDQYGGSGSAGFDACMRACGAGSVLREQDANVDSSLKVAKRHLDSAKKAFEQKKYGEAYGQANSAYAVARAGFHKLDSERVEKHEKILCLEGYVEYKGECRRKEESRMEKPKEEGRFCTQIYDPVCGADGKTYSNSCFADIAHTQIKYRGECDKPTKPALDSGSLKFEAVPQSPTTKISPDSMKVEVSPKTPSIDISAGSVKVETESGTAVNVSRVWDIGITDEGFSPMELKIRKGDTVVWTSKASKSSWPASAMHPTHDVYPERGGCISSAFDSCKGLGFGETFKFVFNHVGSWKYHDHLNSTHFGAIIVE